MHENYVGTPGSYAVEFALRIGELRYWRIAYPQSGPNVIAKGVGPADGGGVGMVLREFLFRFSIISSRNEWWKYQTFVVPAKAGTQ